MMIFTIRIAMYPLFAYAGGPTPAGCTGGVDLFGSIYAAWNHGLWQYLSQYGPDTDVIKEGREGVPDGPGLVVTPSELIVRERPEGESVEALKVKLSGPPQEGTCI